jgi:predicted acyl esterase
LAILEGLLPPMHTCNDRPIDQSALEAAHATTGDMLLFTSGVLKEALPVTGSIQYLLSLHRDVKKQHAPVFIAGPLFATLFVSSNCTDTDVTIKLVDVHPR